MSSDILWYKDAVIYELHVRSFCDSNGDGIGDFQGLTSKLGYLQDLGVTALWLLPFYPSPLKDDGYDIADYRGVNPDYGTLADFQIFLAEAHNRGLRVITELVINHTSDQHPWFQRARQAPAGSEFRDFYVWSETPDRYSEARIIFKDFETSNWAWDPVAKAYYWHRFYSHQPDLNFESPLVRQAVFETLDFWLEMGVDGLRLDAIPYLFEQEGTSCENLPETHDFLRDLRGHLDQHFPGRMLLAEANQWPEDAASYFGNGDECHMEFHFPLMPRLFMAIQMEDRFPVIDILEQTPAIPDNCQWAIFLRNHDELTLEMVTDEERDYMIRIYAEDSRARINLGIRRRLAPLLKNDRRRVELINAILLSLTGTPILYYGDEIGMGDNFYLGDRNGVRTPMQWNADRNAGFSPGNPQQLFLPVIIDPEFHYENVNVDVQMRNLSSLYWWTRRMLSVRQKHPAFSRGTLEFLSGDSAKVLSFLRRHDGEVILVVCNLSRLSQSVELDLSEFRGWGVQEIFGNSRFPDISDRPYVLTLGPHGFFWLSVVAPEASQSLEESPVRQIRAQPVWSEELFRELETKILPGYLRECRWFGGKGGRIHDITITECFQPAAESELRVLFADVQMTNGGPLQQVLPLMIGPASAAEPAGNSAVGRFDDGTLLWDALAVPEGRQQVYQLISRGETWKGRSSVLTGLGKNLPSEVPESKILQAEQSNSSLRYGEGMILKFFRRFEPGSNPDADILRALGEKEFSHVPSYFGEIRWNKPGQSGVAGILTSFVANQGDGWTYTKDALGRFFERVLGCGDDLTAESFAEIAGAVFPERLELLGKRTGELHRHLESLSGPDFAPEPFNSFYQRALYQSLRAMVRRTEEDLRKSMSSLPPDVQEDAAQFPAKVPEILSAYAKLLAGKLSSGKIRIHGDYHLGQVLNTGKDFVILDFEGEPRRPLGERLLKRSPLVDVAGMLRSLDYAMETALLATDLDAPQKLRMWGGAWREKMSTVFLKGYREAMEGSTVIPKRDSDFELLLQIFMLDKAVYEIGYEINYRPSFVRIPLGAISRITGNLQSLR